MTENTAAKNTCVFRIQGERILPTALSRGPWNPNAQHGGAPAGLIAGLAEEALAPEGYQLVRLTLELFRPVPVAELSATVDAEAGRAVRRVRVTLRHGDKTVASGLAVMVRSVPISERVGSDERTLPPPAQCHEQVRIPGMDDVESFHYTAMESKLAGGSTLRPGPAAAWLRLTVPLVEGKETTPFMRIAAASDFGNGISWSMPLDRYMFANTDLTLYIQRPPVSAWVGVDSRTWIEPSGIGITRSVLHDESGPLGYAQQNLLVRERPA
jgi:hypothetical protein